jgi:hypothetical protein
MFLRFLLARLVGRRLAGGLIRLRAGAGGVAGRRTAARLRLRIHGTEHCHCNRSTQQAFEQFIHFHVDLLMYMGQEKLNNIK